jgi:hypothetical protein
MQTFGCCGLHYFRQECRYAHPHTDFISQQITVRNGALIVMVRARHYFRRSSHGRPGLAVTKASVSDVS